MNDNYILLNRNISANTGELTTALSKQKKTVDRKLNKASAGELQN